MSARRIVLASAVAAIALSACGRKAPLDTPYQANVDAREEAQKLKLPPPAPLPKPVEDKPFILDPLI